MSIIDSGDLLAALLPMDAFDEIDSIVRKENGSRCLACGREHEEGKPPMVSCRTCQVAVYCSDGCHRRHRSKHRAQCPAMMIAGLLQRLIAFKGTYYPRAYGSEVQGLTTMAAPALVCESLSVDRHSHTQVVRGVPRRSRLLGCAAGS